MWKSVDSGIYADMIRPVSLVEWRGESRDACQLFGFAVPQVLFPDSVLVSVCDDDLDASSSVGGEVWAPEIVADLKAKVAVREHYELHPEVDVIVATEQEFFDEILPRMFEPMTDEQRFFNEQVAIIEQNKQSALAALHR